MIAIDLLFRFMHILPATVLVGGLFFWRFAVAAGDGETIVAMRRRWSRLVMMSTSILLVSGLVNFILTLKRFDIPKEAFPGNLYHMLFGIKFLLAFAVFVLSALLAGRSTAAEGLRRKERLWLNVNLVLVVVVVCIGALLKFSERRPKSAQSSRPAIVSPNLAAIEHGSLHLNSACE